MSVCGKNHVGLWEKSCGFVGKIMSVCGKNNVSLWEKSCRFVGKILWSENLTGKYPHIHRKKNTGLFTYFCQSTASHNVYLKEKSLKLKTACGIRLCRVLLTAESDTTVFC